jgi:hypothetical protein
MTNYIAFLDNNNLVTQVVQSPDDGQDWLSIYAERKNCKCVETALDGSIRKKFAITGDTYNEDIDAFIGPQPYPSWTLSATEKEWVPPIPLPDDEMLYAWDESRENWVIVYDPAWGIPASLSDLE